MSKKLLAFVIVSCCFSFSMANGAVIPNPLPYETVPELVMAILDGLLYLAGGLFVLLIVWAGLKLMSSFGNPEELKKAKNTIWYCSLGLIALLASKAILEFVRTTLLNT